jgi:hypothetical protein
MCYRVVAAECAADAAAAKAVGFEYAELNDVDVADTATDSIRETKMTTKDSRMRKTSMMTSYLF